MKKLIGLAILAMILIIAPVMLSQMSGKKGCRNHLLELDSSRYVEVKFKNLEQGNGLAGMLFVPEGDGPFPAAVVIHGSGTSRRDSRWYLSLAHYLQVSGVTVLLPDKRGSEKSAGNWRTSSFEDLATDTLAAIQYLKDQNQVALSGIGVIGMSQGGWIAPIVAQQSPDIEFVVSVVGPAVTSHEQLLYEANRDLRQAGFLPGISNVISHMSTLYLRNIGQKDFWKAIGDFDPLPYWSELSVRALALFGRDDSNVPTEESAARLHSLGNPNITVIIYEGSGHALADPVGRGNNLFREDALQDIRNLIGN